VARTLAAGRLLDAPDVVIACEAVLFHVRRLAEALELGVYDTIAEGFPFGAAALVRRPPRHLAEPRSAGSAFTLPRRPSSDAGVSGGTRPAPNAAIRSPQRADGAGRRLLTAAKCVRDH
jgi:hypothetical protein